MPTQKISHETTFGYLSTVKSDEHGYFGGYLVISVLGRPLEFHCTAPVRPSKAQEILYGPTLEAYVVGEQICGALFSVAKLAPVLILSDSETIMQASTRAKAPMLYLPAELGADARSAEHFPQPKSTHASTNCGGCRLPCSSEKDGNDISINGYPIRLPAGRELERDAILASLATLAEHVDLPEPFGRIHEAIREAQRIGARSMDAHDQAA